MSNALRRLHETLLHSKGAIPYELREKLMELATMALGGMPAELDLPKPAEQEALALLCEEAAEVVHAVCKALRHGLNSAHPDAPMGPDNRQLIEFELGQLLAVGRIACEVVLDVSAVERACREKLQTLAPHLHHKAVGAARVRVLEKLEQEA